jgi:hypothetical protein
MFVLNLHFVMFSLLGLYVWCDRKRMRKKKLETFQFDFDPEEQGSRRSVEK